MFVLHFFALTHSISLRLFKGSNQGVVLEHAPFNGMLCIGTAAVHGNCGEGEQRCRKAMSRGDTI